MMNDGNEERKTERMTSEERISFCFTLPAKPKQERKNDAKAGRKPHRNFEIEKDRHRKTKYRKR